MAKRKRLTLPPADFEISRIAPRSVFDAPMTSAAIAPIADVARAASAMGALDEMAQTLGRAREEGRMVLSLPLDDIVLDHLVRDRLAVNDEEMQALMSSIASRGQQTPIEVLELRAPGAVVRFGLISGWRRCQALRRLQETTGEARYAVVQALLRRPDQASDAYLAMVEENEIRVGLSYYERANIVLKSVEQNVFETPKAALQTLFRAASRAKRSKIGSFLGIVHHLGHALRFPEALGERTGLALAKALATDPALADRLAARLLAETPGSARDELAVLAACLDAPAAAPPPARREKPVRLAETVSISPELSIRTHPNGDLTLSGTALTADLRSALANWLRART